jgi:hypothetical protein
MKKIILFTLLTAVLNGCGSDGETDDFFTRRVTKQDLIGGALTCSYKSSAFSFTFEEENVSYRAYREIGSYTWGGSYELKDDSLYITPRDGNEIYSFYVSFVHWSSNGRGDYNGEQIQFLSNNAPSGFIEGYYSKIDN